MRIKYLFLIVVLVASLVYGEERKQTICLNMIVKNEKDVIERCLATVKPYIHYWVIFDTGSSDGTQEVIKQFLHDIPGELHESPWVNFAHNRNEALVAAKGKGDYLLFIDADEVLQPGPGFIMPYLDKDFYYLTIMQRPASDAKRTCLIKDGLDWHWEGVLHETVYASQAKSFDTLKNIANIANLGGGARTKDSEKFVKDAQLMESALKNEPDNSRYVFYIGLSYLTGKKLDLALEYFQKRVKMESHDQQENYLSHYYLAWTLDKLGKKDAAIEGYFKASQFFPWRAEPLFRAAVLYREKGNILLGYLLTKYALSLPVPENDFSFEPAAYDHQILVEFANCALLLGRFPEGLSACNELLANPNLPEEMRPLVMSNRQIAQENLVVPAVQKEK